jgi:hypothetical protein
MSDADDLESSEVDLNPFVFQPLMGNEVMLRIVNSSHDASLSAAASLSTSSDDAYKELIRSLTEKREHVNQPEHSDLTHVTLVGRVIDDAPTILSSSSSSRPFYEDTLYCTVGDSEVIPGVELAIRFMREGERAIVR